jgi:hypothetical protein
MATSASSRRPSSANRFDWLFSDMARPGPSGRAAASSGTSIAPGTRSDINTGSLRQQIVPNHLLGRVISIAAVLAWSAIPVGALAGGWAVERTGSVALVYGVIGALVALLALAFSLGPLGHADRYLAAGGQRS